MSYGEVLQYFKGSLDIRLTHIRSYYNILIGIEIPTEVETKTTNKKVQLDIRFNFLKITSIRYLSHPQL